MVARKDQHIVRVVGIDEFQVLEDRVGSAAVPVASADALIRSQQGNAAHVAVQIPRNSDTDVRVQTQRLILRQNTHGVNTGVDAVAEREVDNTVLSAERYCRLGDFLRQDTKTAALTSCKKHGNHFFFNHDIITSQLEK